jgi:hypothetical protein
VSVKDQDGNVLYTERKLYELYDLHLPSNKPGYLGFDDWDLTAMTHIDELALKPFQTDSLTRVVPLKKDTTSVNVEANYLFIYEKGVEGVIKKETKTVDFLK